jgi:gluconolactonase
MHTTRARRQSATATASTCRAGWSRASTADGASRAPSTTARSVLASHFEGKRFNSPNDVVVKSDGSIWFTDPSYGIDSDYEGDASASEIGAQRVYRIDASSGAIGVVAGDFVQPNGLAFSADESLLYIVDTRATHQIDGPHHVRRFKVGANGALVGGEVFATCGTTSLYSVYLNTHGAWPGSTD